MERKVNGASCGHYSKERLIPVELFSHLLDFVQVWSVLRLFFFEVGFRFLLS